MKNTNNMTSYTVEEIDKALVNLGIEIGDSESTDPKLMKKILSEAGLEIEELIEKTQSKILSRLVKEEISIKPLKESILLGIIHNPPIAQTLIETSDLIAKDKSLKSRESDNLDSKVQLQYGIYLTVIIEVLTHLMVNDKDLEKIISTYILSKRKVINSGSTFWNFLKVFFETKGELFRAIKSVSIDPALFSDLCWREYFPKPSEDSISKFIAEHHLTGLNKSALSRRLHDQNSGNKHYGILCGNILEALTNEEAIVNRTTPFFWFNDLSDHNFKSVDNVKAGLALILYQEKFEEQFSSITYIEKDSKPLYYSNSKAKDGDFWSDLYNYTTEHNTVRSEKGTTTEWVNLYEAWNIAFILRCLPEEFHLFLPKLLIPDTISSNPENYIAANRLISLWLTVNFSDRMSENGVRMKYPKINYDFLLDIFGKNNLAYANNALLENKFNIDSLYKEHIQSKSTLSLYLKSLKVIQGDYLFP